MGMPTPKSHTYAPFKTVFLELLSNFPVFIVGEGSCDKNLVNYAQTFLEFLTIGTCFKFSISLMRSSLIERDREREREM